MEGSIVANDPYLNTIDADKTEGVSIEEDIATDDKAVTEETAGTPPPKLFRLSTKSPPHRVHGRKNVLSILMEKMCMIVLSSMVVGIDLCS